MDRPHDKPSAKNDDMINIPVEDLPIGQDNIAIVTPSEQAAKRQTKVREQTTRPQKKA